MADEKNIFDDYVADVAANHDVGNPIVDVGKEEKNIVPETSNDFGANENVTNVQVTNTETSSMENVNTEITNTETTNIETASIETTNIETTNIETTNAEATNIGVVNVEVANTEVENKAVSEEDVRLAKEKEEKSKVARAKIKKIMEEKEKEEAAEKEREKEEKRKREVIGQREALRRVKKSSKFAMILGAVLMVVSTLCSFLSMQAYQERFEIVMALEQYASASRALTYNIQSYAVTGKEDYLNAYNKEIKEDKNREQAVAILEDYGLTNDEWISFEKIARISKGLEPLESQAIELVKAGNIAEATAVVFGEEYGKGAGSMLDATNNTINMVKERLEGKETTYMLLQWISLPLFILSVAFIIYQLIKTTTFAENELLIPILKISKQMEHMSNGVFSKEIDLEENASEVGKMVESMNNMKRNTHGIINEVSSILEQMGEGNYKVNTKERYVGEYETIEASIKKIMSAMRETFNTIKSVSEQINAGSEQLACAAQDLAEGCTTQATQVAGVVSAMQEMSASMENNAEDAEQSVELSTEAGKILMVSNEKMSELTSAIGEISKCSEQIGTIINAIEEIASQTNLLSLNAAIEAARAGEAGKGFAVVAEQVKNLAEESAAAAGRTTTLIESTIEAVDKGIKIAEEAAEDMMKVMESAKLATDKMGAIANKLKEDNARIHKINDTMTIVSEVVTDNSASSEETAAVSEEQKAQVETMVELMTQFNV